MMQARILLYLLETILKPLFYLIIINKNTFIFSSSLKAIVSSGLIDDSLNTEYCLKKVVPLCDQIDHLIVLDDNQIKYFSSYHLHYH